MTFPLYNAFTVDVPFTVIVNCIITDIQPEFTTTAATYYIGATAMVIDLSQVVYN